MGFADESESGSSTSVKSAVELVDFLPELPNHGTAEPESTERDSSDAVQGTTTAVELGPRNNGLLHSQL